MSNPNLPPASTSTIQPNSLTQQLAQSERIFALLVRSVKDYGIFMLDPRGIVMTWNEGAERILGYTAEQIVGRHFSAFYSEDAMSSDHPADELAQALAEGSYEEEGWRVRADGQKFWASVVITPVFEDNQLIGFAKVTRDLSEKRQSELERAEASRAAEVFRLLVNSVKDYAIFMLDSQGHIKTWNEGAQRIKGYTADDIIGKHFSIFYTQQAKDTNHPEHELEIAIAKGKYEEEGWRVRKDGTLFWANVLITALFENGELIGFAKVTRDLTERKNSERAREQAFEQVKAANDELHGLAYSISHELQEPIQSINSYSKLLHSRYSERLGTDADEFLDRILRGAKLTSKLVDDLWTYSRITRPSASHLEIDSGRVLQDAQDDLNKLIEESKATITHPPYNEFPRVHCNKEQLLYVFKEMIANAIKHNTINQPSVDVSFIRERNGWTFNFRDNGPGIDRFFAQQAFSFYQRLDRKPDETGTGMGLPICKKIIEQAHKGRIGFETARSGGTEFFVWLPDPTD